jgi:hypothetical protein
MQREKAWELSHIRERQAPVRSSAGRGFLFCVGVGGQRARLAFLLRLQALVVAAEMKV